jgi:phosphoribosylamine---glycine ligase
MVIGNGGRECALAKALLESPGVERVIIAPPNWGVRDARGGGSRIVQLELSIKDQAAVVEAARALEAQLVVIGPEDPLCAGLADALRAAGIPALGPGRMAAQLEGSKAFAKDFMHRHGIPTAATAEFTDLASLRAYIEATDRPLVLKADGLAAGKGVLICATREEALAGAVRLMEAREFGSAGDRVLVEELLVGREISFTCLVASAPDYLPAGQLVATSTDYKRLLDGDAGPNTGGMGNVCPSPFAPPEVVEEFYDKVFAPVLLGLSQDQLDYRGFLFIGAMLTEDGLKVLEFNVRLGDPEAEVVLPLSAVDWAKVLGEVAAGQLQDTVGVQRAGACVAVVLASGNYPYGKSEPAVIEGLERIAARGLLDGDPPPVRIYFSGVSVSTETVGRASAPAIGLPQEAASSTEPVFMATGGRVLVVSALGRDLSEARRIAYEITGNIRFDGMQFRSDIGQLR